MAREDMPETKTSGSTSRRGSTASGQSSSAGGWRGPEGRIVPPPPRPSPVQGEGDSAPTGALLPTTGRQLDLDPAPVGHPDVLRGPLKRLMQGDVDRGLHVHRCRLKRAA